MSNIVTIGDKVELRAIKAKKIENSKEKVTRTYKSKVLDVVDENVYKLAMPIEGGSIKLLPVDAVLDVFFYASGGLYQSKGKVIERLKEDNLYVLLLELTQPIKKNQRREFFRYNCTIDMSYAKITEDESKLILPEDIEEARGEKITWNEGYIVDISGGGVRFTTSDEFAKESYLIAKFNLMINKKMRQFTTIIKVISSEKILNRSGQYENRGKYLSLKKEEVEEIVRYIFEEERKARKNGKS